MLFIVTFLVYMRKYVDKSSMTYWSFQRKTILDDRPETDVFSVDEIHC